MVVFIERMFSYNTYYQVSHTSVEIEHFNLYVFETSLDLHDLDMLPWCTWKSSSVCGDKICFDESNNIILTVFFYIGKNTVTMLTSLISPSAWVTNENYLPWFCPTNPTSNFANIIWISLTNCISMVFLTLIEC